MAEALDKQVAQAVAETRLLERALHDHAAHWGMRWRGVTVPAERVVTESGVTFYASFPAILDSHETTIWLLVDGVERRSREMDIDVRAALDFTWTLSLESDRSAVEA
jgi:hypothetical protein